MIARLPFYLILILNGLACNRSRCEALRDQLTEEKAHWQSCEQDRDCVIVGGNPKDCSGVMSCDLAVNREFQASAERRVASLPEASVDCLECASPNCTDGKRASCDGVRHRCTLGLDVETSHSTAPSAGDVPSPGANEPSPIAPSDEGASSAGGVGGVSTTEAAAGTVASGGAAPEAESGI